MQHRLVFIVLIAVLLAASGVAWTQPDHGAAEPRMFGIGQPANIDDLPPGRIQERLASLPPPARARALEWLQRLEFPAADLEVMQIDDQGGVLYIEPLLPSPLPGGERD